MPRIIIFCTKIPTGGRRKKERKNRKAREERGGKQKEGRKEVDRGIRVWKEKGKRKKGRERKESKSKTGNGKHSNRFENSRLVCEKNSKSWPAFFCGH